jgi:hypothetical protein
MGVGIWMRIGMGSPWLASFRAQSAFIDGQLVQVSENAHVYSLISPGYRRAIVRVEATEDLNQSDMELQGFLENDRCSECQNSLSFSLLPR